MPRFRILGWYNQNLQVNHIATDYDEAKQRAGEIITADPRVTIEILETRARVKASNEPVWTEYLEAEEEVKNG